MRVLKRLAFAFGVVMIMQAMCGLISEVRGMPNRFSGLLVLSLMFLAPSLVYLVALYGSPILSAMKSTAFGVVRMAILTVTALALTLASVFAFFAIWAIGCDVLGIPIRQG